MDNGPVTAEVPVAALSDSFISWSQPLVAIWLLVASCLSIRPLGGSGLGLAAQLLVSLCAAQAFSRSLPDPWIPAQPRLAITVAGTVCCGLLFGIASNSWGVSWAYLISGHVGFRFPARIAAPLVGLLATIAVVTLAVGPHLTTDAWDWWTGLTVIPPVLTGVSRQNRLRTLANAREVVAQTRRALASESEAAALAERNRIARDLHDVLAHSLSGLSVQLDTADALIEAGRADDGRAAVQKARELVVEGLVQARNAVRTLREDDLDFRDGLTSSVHGAERVLLDGPLETVPTPLARATLRVVQEALTNVRRHAPGAVALIEVTVGERLHVVVSNEAPPSPVAPFQSGSGLGLVGVHERVEALGGTVTAGPTSRGGWRVEADLPSMRQAERMDSIRVVVADDQTVIRESVAMMLDLQPDLDVVGTAADGREAVDVAVAERAEVVLMDLNMPLLDGAGATAELTRLAPEVAVLVLTTFGDDESILRALSAGARGYLTKDAGRAEITQAIRAVASGQAVLDAGVQRSLLAAALSRTPIAAAPEVELGLTPRETDVLRLMAEGRTNREIARRLVISEGTVKTHINNLFAKTGVPDRAAAVAFAFRHGLGPAD